MWPWGHLAVGYLSYTVLVHLSARRPPAGPAAVAVAFGTQFPDLVDKPLAWSLGVLPSGRSLAHSLLVAALVVVALDVVARRRGYSSVGTAFGVGYGSHLLGDAVRPVVYGDYGAVAFLAWPLLAPVEYGTDSGFLAHFGTLALTPDIAAELALGVVVFVVWLADGVPGIEFVRRVPAWLGRKLSV